jgi:hypothetical protein
MGIKIDGGQGLEKYGRAGDGRMESWISGGIFNTTIQQYNNKHKEQRT